jgi:2-polyprenyl-6-hydroxyphenyl methylase / 3-demethylubiquinone-9 3-methyltransferase
VANAVLRPRNDPAQYDDLTDEWWKPFGAFAALNWLAMARASLIPPAPYAGAPLLDIACGAGLMAPHLHGQLAGWRHVGLDLSALSLQQARAHGVASVRADALALPFADASLHGVLAGEVLEHVHDLERACAEIARVLAPGGVVVIDTIADSVFARIALVRIAERFHGGPPPRIHDPALFVDPLRLRLLFEDRGVHLSRPTGLRPSIRDYMAWRLRRTDQVRMLPVRSTSGVYQTIGTKEDR